MTIHRFSRLDVYLVEFVSGVIFFTKDLRRPNFLMSMFNSLPQTNSKSFDIKRTFHLPSINFQVLLLLVSEEGSISEVLLVHENQPFFFANRKKNQPAFPGG